MSGAVDPFRKVTDGLTRNHKNLSPRLDIGEGGVLKLLPLAHLYVDTRYQREVSSRGHANIRHMVEHFFWSQFQPIVVSKIGPNKYAIIDGQHRAHACALHPEISEIPALVLDIPLEEQARAFAAINVRVTKIQPLQIFWAGIRGGDEEALAIQAATDKAGVTIYAKRPPAKNMKDGYTLAISALRRHIRLSGEDVVVRALGLIMTHWEGMAEELMAQPIHLMCYFVRDFGDYLTPDIEARIAEVSSEDLFAGLDGNGGSKTRRASYKLAQFLGLSAARLAPDASTPLRIEQAEASS